MRFELYRALPTDVVGPVVCDVVDTWEPVDKRRALVAWMTQVAEETFPDGDQPIGEELNQWW